MPTTVPFPHRFGFEPGKPIYDDFPAGAKVALSYLLDDLVRRKYVSYRYVIIEEIGRVGRHTGEPPDDEHVSLYELIGGLSWTQIYIFCERIYSNLLQPVTYQGQTESGWETVEEISLQEVRDYYSNELNQILNEENIGYEFVNGLFQRRGRPQTQKSIQRAVGKVLSDPRFTQVSQLFNKALSHLNKQPVPDLENCTKDALIALEACLEILTGEPASKQFNRVVEKCQGNEPGQIPAPIAQAMIKLHSYRGSGQGVGHAALGGNKVEAVDAELVLSTVAAFITYLIDLFPRPEDDIPF